MKIWHFKRFIKDQDGVAVHDLTYAAYNPQYGFPVKGRMSAYLVTPSGGGPFAGAVYMHWMGQPNGSRNEFLDEAVTLAPMGVVSILVQGVFPWFDSPSGYDADRVQVINQVIELRRALDVLLAQPGVDPQRIGYVGHDYGALFGGVLSGVDHRIKAYVFMAGMGSFSDWSLKYWPATSGKGEGAYREAMSIVDPIGYIHRATPAALLFQFAKYDGCVSKEAALRFYNVGSEPKQIQWYDAQHNLHTDEDRRDRIAWLSGQLALKQENLNWHSRNGSGQKGENDA